MNCMVALLVLAAVPLLAQADRFGLPSCSAPDLELSAKRFFFVCHSASLRAPVWAIHELSPSRLAVPVSLRRARFRRDRSLSAPGASDADYRNSGWSRGHLVPARDMSFDEQAWLDSFLLSNAVPQNVRLNGSAWRRLENQVRKTAETADSVVVITGAIFTEDAERIGAGGVAVPAALYKVILVLEHSRAWITAAILPNTESRGSLDSFAVPVAEVERRAGLKFFHLLEPALSERRAGVAPNVEERARGVAPEPVRCAHPSRNRWSKYGSCGTPESGRGDRSPALGDGLVQQHLR